MKKLLHIALVALLAISTSAHAETEKHEAKPYKEVTAEEVQKLQADNKETVVIDTRGAKYLDGKVIKGAKVLSTDKFEKAAVEKLAPNKAAPLVLYCQNTDCPASAKAAHKAKDYGYTNILKYPGGIEDWVEKGLPTDEIKK